MSARLAAAAAVAVLAPLLGVGVLAGAIATGGTGAALCLAPPAGQNTGGAAGEVTGEQRRNTGVIVAETGRMRLPARAAVIATATALQESGLRNITYGDRDSLGLFQQRPSMGWGTREQILDPAHATRSFLQHLAKVPGWQQRPLTEVAAAVQRPDARYAHLYAHHEPTATALVHAALGQGGMCPEGGQRGSAAVQWAMTQLGKPYVWGAEGPDAYDCSGLTLQAWRRAGVQLSRTTYTQINDGTHIPRDQLAIGDLVFFDTLPGTPGPDHVGLYAGEGRMVHAPNSRETVKIENLAGNAYYMDRLAGAVRPKTASEATRRTEGTQR